MTQLGHEHSIYIGSSVEDFLMKSTHVKVHLECDGKAIADKEFNIAESTPADLEVWATEVMKEHVCDTST